MTSNQTFFAYLSAAIIYVVLCGFVLDYFVGPIHDLPYWTRYVIWTIAAVPFLWLCAKAYQNKK